MTGLSRAAGLSPLRSLRRASLRTRLLLTTAALLAIGLVVSNIVVTGTLRHDLLEQVDNRVTAAAEHFSRTTPAGLTTPAGAFPSPMDLLSDTYVAYLTPEGRIERLLRSPEYLHAPEPVLPALPATAMADRGGRLFDVWGQEDSGHWRVTALPRRPDSATAQSPGSVVVAVPLRPTHRTIARAIAVCWLTALGLLSVLVLVGWFAIRRGLRPLRRIENTAAAIAGGDLSRRIPDVAAPKTEVARLSASLNGMLGQIETAFHARAESEAKIRRFVADVSHELRTPLVGIKGFTELADCGRPTRSPAR